MRTLALALALAAALAAWAQAPRPVTRSVTEMMGDALAASKAGRYAEAADMFAAVCDSTEGESSPEWRQAHTTAMELAGKCYTRAGENGRALEIYRRLVSMETDTVHRENIGNMYALNGYLCALKLMSGDVGRYADARRLMEEVRPYADSEVARRISLRLPATWMFEGMRHNISLRLDSAAYCMDNALRLYEEAGDVAGQADALLKLGGINRMAGDTRRAERLFDDARARAVRQADQETLAKILAGQLDVYQSLNDMAMYNRTWMALDSLAEATDNRKVKAEYYQRRGIEARQQGDYGMAGYYFGLYRDTTCGTDSAHNMEHMALYYTMMRETAAAAGNHKAALDYGLKGVKAYEAIYAPGSGERYRAYTSLAAIYAELADTAGVEACIDSIANIERLGTGSTRERAWVHTSAGLCYARLGMYARAIDEYTKADSLLAGHCGQDDEQRLNITANMAGMLYKEGDHAGARSLYARYAKGIKTLRGDTSTEYGNALCYLANIEAFNGNIGKACSLYARSAGIITGNVKAQLRNVAPTERENYWKEVSATVWNMSAFALKAGATSNGFTEACYDALLFSKALLLETERSMLDMLRSRGTPEDVDDFLRMSALQARIKDLSRNFAANREKIAALQAQARTLDKALAERSRVYGDYTAFLDIRYGDIRRSLKDGEVLVDFTDFTSDEKVRQYAAYVIRNDFSHPLLLKVFTAEAADSLLAGGEPDMLYSRTLGGRAQSLLWGAIEPYATEGSTVYYVPSGRLFGVALESLPDARGTLLGSRYRFVRLSSARQVAQSQRPAESGPTATLYGGLRYDIGAADMAEESRKYHLPPLLASRGVTRGGSGFGPLPGSKEEVEAIGATLEAAGCKVDIKSGTEGTEESFVSMSGHSPRILHMATHGFYFTPEAAEGYSYLRGYTDAMALSGIVLAGGNAAWTGKALPKGVLGGILTAQDIARLDLSGTDMVVLSACRSGQGKVTPEGLFGLQRAFKKAGAGTIVTTLWNVSDMATKEFMTAFYTALASNGWDKRAAFSRAQAAVRAKYPEPFYWAGFTIMD